MKISNMSRQRNLKYSKFWNPDKHACEEQSQSGNRRANGGVERNTASKLKSAYLYIVLFVVIVLIAGVLSVHFSNHLSLSAKATVNSKTLLTEEELFKHDGSDPHTPIYLSILGSVYDVDKGRRHYEVGSGYNVFAGRDSTPSFVTGVFSKEEATDDVKGLSPEEMLGIKEWLDFYRKDYTYVGKLIGRYYDSNGNPTEALKEAKAVIKKGKELKKLQEAENKRFPGCNSRWSAEEGSTVWCSQNSAGINRDWVGVPRKMFKPGKTDARCVCVKTTGPSSDTGEGDEGDLKNPNLQQYPGCDKYDASCKLQN